MVFGFTLAHEVIKTRLIVYILEAHNGDQPSFSTNVLKSFKDPLSRQVYEGSISEIAVEISLTQNYTIINTWVTRLV